MCMYCVYLRKFKETDAKPAGKSPTISRPSCQAYLSAPNNTNARDVTLTSLLCNPPAKDKFRINMQMMGITSLAKYSHDWPKFAQNFNKNYCGQIYV